VSAATDLFAQKAQKNIVKWGLQDYETLALAVAEEAGELAQAVLQFRHEGGSDIRIIEEAADLGALCDQVFTRYNTDNGARS
jgi:NTP pyrophosphatase (non-canonical NTP hydrolase)